MKSVKILHLSDLHLRNPCAWDQERIISALMTDIAKLRFTSDAPDLIVFSGDLVLGAALEEAYAPVFDLLVKIMEALDLSEDRLIICPGNHDINRDVVGANIPALEDYRSSAWTYSGANKLIEDRAFQSYVAKAFNEYNSLAGALSNQNCTYSDAFSSVYYIRDLGLAIVVFNTATLCAGGIIDKLADQGKLFVSEKTIVTSLDKVPNGIVPLVVGHHPPSWFSDDNQSIFERILAGKTLGYLSGHLHDVSPRQSQLLSGGFLHVQSGALYCGRNYWNGYGLINIAPEEGHARIAYRRWFEHRLGFSKAEDLGDDGVFYSSESAKHFFDALTPGFDLHMLERWRVTKLLPHLSEKCANLVSNSPSDNLFVPPDFDREVPFRTEGEARIGSRVETFSIDDIISSKLNYVISARLESGKSTLLNQIAHRIAQQSAFVPKWAVPVVIQFNSIKTLSKSIDKLVKDQLPDLEISANSLLEGGHITILVDDMDFNIIKKKKALVDFVINYPKCRYIFATSTTFVETAALQPEIVPDIPFTRVRMRPFRKGHLQTLVENHGLTDPKQVDQMVERVIRDASALNVPLTAVTGTFLIQIIREEPDSTVLNQASLIERYIEMLLQKYAPRELLPGTFDFRNKVDLLCNVAEIMTRQDEYDPTENDLIGWCIAYLKEYGLRYTATDLVNYFVEARILERHGDRIRFRLRMFFEFFAATRMSDSPEFKDYIFDDSRYLAFINEIGFYSALNRRDKAKIDDVHIKFLKLTEELNKVDKLEDVHAFFRDLAVPMKTTTEEELTSLRGHLKTPEQIDSLRKELSEGTDLHDQEQSQSVIRQRFNTPQEKWVGHLLLLSGMVKHMELIKDADKRRLLTGAVEGWARFTAMSMDIVSELAVRKRVVFNGVTYRSSLGDDLPVGETARRLTLYMPIAVARMASVFVGTEKLRLQIEDGIGSEEEPAARQFLRMSILADLGVPGLPEVAKKASERMGDSQFLQHVLARKLYEVAVRFRLNKEELAEIRDIVGNSFIQLNNTPRGKQIASKNNIIAGMEQQRLQLKLGKR
ncbi:metallophosphoesterase [Methylobacterium radiotolerans]|nr:3',5'-cyclic adenosine monophosphate phosphodiesterase CpdA [Methylobacterium radiotolerans]